MLMMTMKRRESQEQTARRQSFFSEATIFLKSVYDADVDDFYDSFADDEEEQRVGATATGLFLLSLAAPPW